MAKWTQEMKDAAKIKYAEKMEKVKIEKDPSNFIEKVEKFNGETVPKREETNNLSNWSEEDKLNTIINTARILPSSMVVNGRHLIENLQAFNVITVTQELVDIVYSIYTHDEYGQLIKRSIDESEAT